MNTKSDLSLRRCNGVLLLALAAVMLPALAHAQFTYTTNADTTLTITGYTGPMGAVTIPTNISGVTVTGIATNAFAANANITGVTIPGAITNLGTGLFSGCTNLSSVVFGPGSTLITTSEFQNCTALTNLVVPSNVMTIGDRAYLGCSNLSNVSITPGAGSIGQFGFAACAVTNLTLPVTVTNIGVNAFDDCAQLTNMVILGNCNIGASAFAIDTPPFSSIYVPPDVLQSVYIAGGTIGLDAFAGCTNLSSVTLGVLVNGAIPAGVTNIQNSAFSGCTALSGIIIPANLTTISSFAFRNCTGVTDVVIPANAFVGPYAFQGCTNLGNLVVTPGTTNIQAYAFANTGLTNLIIPASVANIGSNAFSGCVSLTNLLILGNCNIGSFAFSATQGIVFFSGAADNALQSVYIAGGTIGYEAFFFCTNLSVLTLGNQVTSIGFSPFCGTALRNLVIPDSCISIGDGAFEDCALTNLDLGQGVQSIGDHAFYENFEVTSLALPPSLRTVGDQAFLFPLTNLTIANGVTTFSDRAFVGTRLSNITFPPSVGYFDGFAEFAANSNLTSMVFLGNAPLLGPYGPLFDTPNNVTVFYLPGATGWNTNFSNARTAVWNPAIQKHDGNFGLRNGRFGFNLTGPAYIPVAIQSSTNPKSGWTNVTTVTLTNGSFYFSDPQPVSGFARFYRLSPPP